MKLGLPSTTVQTPESEPLVQSGPVEGGATGDDGVVGGAAVGGGVGVVVGGGVGVVVGGGAGGVVGWQCRWHGGCGGWWQASAGPAGTSTTEAATMGRMIRRRASEGRCRGMGVVFLSCCATCCSGAPPS